jgi:hypothetical protein
MRTRGLKYTFVTAIEGCAQHICATEGWGPPADNGDAVRLLGEHGVCAPELARSIRQAVGFRCTAQQRADHPFRLHLDNVSPCSASAARPSSAVLLTMGRAFTAPT